MLVRGAAAVFAAPGWLRVLAAVPGLHCRHAPTTRCIKDIGSHICGSAPIAGPAPEQQPVVMVVSGPSGVGKDAVVNHLRSLRPDLHFVVTATSRPKRATETDGVDYHFVTAAQFEQWEAEGALLEHAIVYGQHKGIPKQQVEAALAHGTDVVLRLDVQGTATVRRLMPQVVTAFVAASSERALVQRLVARNTDSPGDLIHRAGTIKEEGKRMQEFDYVIVNEEGQMEAAAQMLSAIIDAERCRNRDVAQ